MRRVLTCPACDTPFEIPPRPDIHWENDSEGAHFDQGCCR